MQTYQKLSEVLTYLRGVHDRVRRVCEAFGDITLDDQLQLLMMSFAELEAKLEQTLHTAELEQPTEILETRVQYVPTRPVDILVDRMESMDKRRWREIATSTLQVHDATVTLYEGVLEQITAEPVREALTALATEERESGKEMSRKLLSLQEM